MPHSESYAIIMICTVYEKIYLIITEVRDRFSPNEDTATAAAADDDCCCLLLFPVEAKL